MKVLPLLICVFVLAEKCSENNENQGKFLLNTVRIEKQTKGYDNKPSVITWVALLIFSEKAEPSTVRANILLQQKDTKKREELVFDFSKNPLIRIQISNKKLKKKYELKIGSGLKSIKGSPLISDKEIEIMNETNCIQVLYNDEK